MIDKIISKHILIEKKSLQLAAVGSFTLFETPLI
jgi:hypothetical protein